MINQRQFDFISHLDNAVNADVRSRVINEFNDEVLLYTSFDYFRFRNYLFPF